MKRYGYGDGERSSKVDRMTRVAPTDVNTTSPYDHCAASGLKYNVCAGLTALTTPTIGCCDSGSSNVRTCPNASDPLRVRNTAASANARFMGTHCWPTPVRAADNA